MYDDSSGDRWGIFQDYVRKRARRRMDLCLSLLPQPRGKDVIELGCGPGYYAARLIGQGARWTGLDVSSAMLASSRKNTGSGRLVLADVLDLPFRDGCCDILLCVGVLSYLRRKEISDLVTQVARIVRTGGLFLTQTVRFDPLTWIRCRLPRRVPRPVRIPGPFYPRAPRTILGIMNKAGLTVQRVASYRKFAVYPAGTIYLAEKK